MKRLLRYTALAVAALLVAFTALGLMLPRDLRIQRRVDLSAPATVVAAEVFDLGRWQGWAFGAEAEGCTFKDPRPDALRWTCGDVDGALFRTDLSGQALWIDAKVAGQIENVRMKVALVEGPAGTQLIWEEQARAPRVMGAWLRPWLERARAEQIDAALARLGQRLQSSGRGT